MKKHYLLFVFISLLSSALQAQTNDSTYTILTTFDASCTGPLLENIPGQYISLKTLYGEGRYDYNMIATIRNSHDELVYPSNTTGHPIPVINKSSTGGGQKGYVMLDDSLFIADQRYRNWYKGFLITGKDTVPVKIEERKEYNFMSSIHTDETDAKTSDQSAVVIYKDGTYKKLKPKDINKLVIYYDGQPTEYLALGDTVYQVLVDGPCKLVVTKEYDTKITLDFGAPMMVPGGNGAMMGGGMTKRETTKFLIHYQSLYKGQVWDIYTKKEATISHNTAGFKKNCLELVADCPAVYDKVKHGNYNHENLEQMIKDFNQCLQGKGK